MATNGRVSKSPFYPVAGVRKDPVCLIINWIFTQMFRPIEFEPNQMVRSGILIIELAETRQLDKHVPFSLEIVGTFSDLNLCLPQWPLK